jgi:hypothetical protein
MNLTLSRLSTLSTLKKEGVQKILKQISPSLKKVMEVEGPMKIPRERGKQIMKLLKMTPKLNGIVPETYRELTSQLIIISALAIAFIILLLIKPRKEGVNNG